MKLISVNVGEPKLVVWNGKSVVTGIFKDSVTGKIPLRRLNLDGDRQADLSVHGGVSKAVYAYPLDHYPYWREQYPDLEFAMGMFGENLTIEGLDENELCIGDRVRVGTAELTVTEPRMPCFKLGVRFGHMDVVKRFADSRKPGVYFLVSREGEVEAGDAVEIVERDPRRVSVVDIVRVHLKDKDDADTMRRALEIDVLPAQWREEFRERLGMQ
jgi:MOSC domain-containing protein YiiM